MGKQWKLWQTLFWGAPKSLQMVAAAMKLKMLAPWEKSYDQPRQHIKKQRHYFANKGPKLWFFQLSCMDLRGYKESWTLKCWCFWTVVLEKTLESFLDSKEFKPINPKDDQYWIFIERTDAEAEAPVFGHLMWRADSLEETLMLREKLRAGGPHTSKARSIQLFHKLHKGKIRQSQKTGLQQKPRRP